ncbi:MAG: Stk1 family PASTA domain-containing Ser/Thr kinase [Oscillospiraceae bacterium]|nr:Stk1 family PASTA domain-containing Ser/Thr kinase [Oscillospiraceae bacterium]
MDKFTGKRLDGRYEIKELIGIGGMSNVYKAYNIVEDRDVAIKIMKEEFLNNVDFLKRFRNESKAIAALSHPNIVKIFDVNFGDRIQYIVMEYIDGITMKEYIEQIKILRWKDAVHFIVQILRALQHAHDKGIVHRDIKPHNIMLLQDGTIKVMDFGIARFAREEGRISEEKAIGSVHYISPEQATGSRTDEKSDVYSVGIMLYEMLTGKLPFEGTTPENVAMQHMQATPMTPREHNETIPEGLEEIVVRAMQKNPGSRYQSVAEMLRDIDEFKRNPGIVFEYKYFSNENPTKYFNKLDGQKSGFNVGGKEPEQGKKSATIPILAGIASAFVLVAVLFIVFVIALGGGGNSGDIRMPDLVGVNFRELDVENDYNGDLSEINFIVTTGEEHDIHDKDVITFQSVAFGRSIKATADVEITLSKGLKRHTVPSMEGLEVAEARRTIEGLGLELENGEPKKEISDTVPEGRVTRTEPKAGEQISKEQKVQLFVSLGSGDDKEVRVPNVVGKTESDARSELEQEGFVVQIKQVESSNTAGTVVKQSPSASASRKKGTEVVIEVSTGKAPESTLSFKITKIPKNLMGTAVLTVYKDGVAASRNDVNLALLGTSYSFNLTGDTRSVRVIVTIRPKSGGDEQRVASYTANFVSKKVTQNENIPTAFNRFRAASSSSSAPPPSQPPSSSLPPSSEISSEDLNGVTPSSDVQ